MAQRSAVYWSALRLKAAERNMEDAPLILKTVVRDKILWACFAGISAAFLFGFVVLQPLYGPRLLFQVLR